MFTLPQILPADPQAPEAFSRTKPALTYGPLARTILFFEGRTRNARS